MYEIAATTKEECESGSFCMGGELQNNGKCFTKIEETSTGNSVECGVKFNNWSHVSIKIDFGAYDYTLDWKKVCLDKAMPSWDPSSYILIIIAIICVYVISLETAIPRIMDENNNPVEEELKWYHTIFFVVFASGALI